MSLSGEIEPGAGRKLGTIDTVFRLIRGWRQHRTSRAHAQAANNVQRGMLQGQEPQVNPVSISPSHVGALAVLSWMLISGPEARAAGGRVVTPSGPDTESCGTAAQLSESMSHSAPKNDRDLAARKLLFLLSMIGCFCGHGEDNNACANLVTELNEACGGVDFTCVAYGFSRLPRSQ